MSERKKIQVDVISDVMCPWCYIGKKHLDAAIGLAEELDIEVRWRPFQLDSTLPKEGRDRQDYLNTKFGGKERANEIYGRIKQAGSELGIDFDFDAMKVSPNTMDAHRLIQWAGGQDTAMQDRVVTRLFESFFLEGGHIGKDETLIKIAKDAGMDEQLIASLLGGDDDTKRVADEIEHARNNGVSGVPCFVIDNKFVVTGAQPAATLAQAFRHAASEKSEAAQYSPKN